METHNVIKIYDELYNPIKYGNENVPSEKPICHDCGVKFGRYHHNNCDMEECPKCGMQLISCDCDDVTYINMDLKELNKTKLQQYHHHIIKTKEENEAEYHEPGWNPGGAPKLLPFDKWKKVYDKCPPHKK